MFFLNKSQRAFWVSFTLFIVIFAASANAMERTGQIVTPVEDWSYTATQAVGMGESLSVDFSQINIQGEVKIEEEWGDDTQTFSFSANSGTITKNISWTPTIANGWYSVTVKYSGSVSTAEGSDLSATLSIPETSFKYNANDEWYEVSDTQPHTISINTTIQKLNATITGDFTGGASIDGALGSSITVGFTSTKEFEVDDTIFYSAGFTADIVSGVSITSGAVALPPEVTDVQIEYDGEPRVTTTFTATATVNHFDPADLKYQWLKNGSAIPGETNKTLVGSGQFAKKDQISVEVTAENDEGKSTDTSPAVTIVNTPPTKPTIALIPDTPTTLHSLTVEITPGVDDDGDDVVQNIKWTFDGSDQPDLDGKSTIGPGIPKDTVIVVTVTPSDDDEDGEAETATITIQNSPPTIDPIGDQIATEGSEFTLDLDLYVSDPDLDSLTIGATIDPANAGLALVGTTIRGTPTNVPAEGQIYTVTVTASDDDDVEATPQTFEINVVNANTPPVIADIDDQEVVITVDPTSGTVTVSVDVTDADGDKVMVQATSPDMATAAIAGALGPFNLIATTYVDSPLALTLTFTFSAADAGKVYSIKLSANDNSGALNGVTETEFSISVREEDQAQPNVPPKLEIPDQKLTKSQNPADNIFDLNLTDYATDPEGQSMTFSTVADSSLPNGATLDPSGLFSWNFDATSAGVYIIPFEVTDTPSKEELVSSDTTKQTAKQLVTFNVVSPNFPPVIDSIVPAAPTVMEGHEISITVTASDPNNDFLTLTATGPGWLIFDPMTLSFTEPNIYSQTASGIPPFDTTDGPDSFFDITFEITDTDGAAASETVQVQVSDVNRPPVIDGPDALTVFEDGSVSFPVNATDPDDDTLTFTKVSGEGVFDPDTLIYTLDLTNRFDLATETQDGKETVQIEVDDGKTGTDQLDVDITIKNTNQPVSIASINPQTVAEGEPFSILIVAGDPDLPDGIPIANFSYAAIPPLPFTASFDSGSVNFTGTPGYEDAGDYNVTVTVQGVPDEDVAHSSFVLTVENANRPPSAVIPDLDAAGDTRLIVELPEYVTDPDNDDVVFELLEGPEGLELSPSGRLVWTPVGLATLGVSPLQMTPEQSAQLQIGSYPVTVKVEDVPQEGTPKTVDAKFTINVSLANIPPMIRPPLTDQVVNAGDEVVSPISVTKILFLSTDSSVNFSVTPPDKGDVVDQADPVAIFESPTFSIYQIDATYRWQTTAEDAGQHNISILITDAQGGQTAGPFTVTVGGNPPVIKSVDDIEVDEGETPVELIFDTEDPVDKPKWTYEFDGDNRAPSSFTSQQEEEVVSSDTTLFSWTPNFDEDNRDFTYNLEVKVTDSSGLYDTERVAITVKNFNQLPELDPVSIIPTAPYGLDDLVVDYTVPIDPDGDNILLKTAWKKDGVTQPGFNDSEVVGAEATTAGETWSVEVWASDPFGDSEKQTAEVTILDSPAQLTVKQTGTGKGDKPIVIAGAYGDPDGTPPVVSVQLSIEEETAGVVVDEEITNSAEPASLIGEYIFDSLFPTGFYTYTVSAADIPPEIGTFEVSNAPPVLYAPEVTGFASGNIPLNVGFEDPDGDSMDVQVLYNGAPAAVSGPTTVTDGTYLYTWDSNADAPNAAGDTYTLEIIVDDGIESTTANVSVQLFNIVGLWFKPRLRPIPSPAPTTVSVQGGLGVGVTYDFDEPWWFAFLGAWNFSTSLSVNGQQVSGSPNGSFWYFTYDNVQLNAEIKNEIQAKYTYEYVYGVLWFDTSAGQWRFDTKRGRNSGQPSAPIYVTCDVIPPEVAILNPEKDDAVIPTKTPKLTAKITDNFDIDTSTITFDIDGSVRIPDFNPDTGIATYEPPVGSPLAPGPHTFTASAKDKAGNPGSDTREFVVDPLAEDNVPPTLVGTSPADGDVVATKNPVVSISVADAQSKLDQGSISVQPAHLTPSYSAIDIKSGVVTFDYTEELEDGEHTASLTIADEAGNSDTFGFSFEVDTTGPTAPTLVVPECVADQSLTVTGETEPGARLKLILNGTLYQEISSDLGNGAYSFVDIPLANGSNTLFTIPTDLLGNLGEPSEKKTVVYDTVPPVITVSSPNPNQIVSKLEVPISAGISDNCGVDKESIQLTVNGVPLTNYSFNENTGKLSFKTPPLPDNETIPVTIDANDLSGLSADYEFSFETRAGIADIIPPVIDNVWIAGTPVGSGDEVTVSTDQPEISASVIDADSEIDQADVLINGSSIPSQYDETTGVVMYQPEAQDDDTYNVQISATDTAEPPNTASFFFSYTVKTSLPKPIVKLDQNVERTNAESIDVKVSNVDKGITAVWNVNGVPVFSYKFTGEASYGRAVLLSEGNNEIIAEVSDDSGNSNSSDPVTVVKDTAPPSVNLEDPVNADRIPGGTVNVQLSVLDPSGVPDVTLDVEGPSGPILPTSNSLTSYTVNANDDGMYNLTVIATDGVGNQAPQAKAFSFTADSTPPEVRIDSPTAAEATALPYSSPGLTGYVNPNDVNPNSIIVSIDGSEIVHMYNAGSGQVYITPQEFADGDTPTLRIEAEDAVGNPNSAERTFTIDTDAKDKTNPVLASFFPLPDSTISGTGLGLLQFVAADSGGINPELVTVTINGKTFRLGALGNVQENRGTFTIFLDRSLLALDKQQLELGQLERGGFQFNPMELGALERSFGSGTNSISVQATDNTGNVSTNNWNFNVVTDPPKVPVLDEISPNVVSSSNITLTGNVADVSSSNPVKVSMYVNGTVIRTVNVVEDGSFSAENLRLIAGENQIAAKATDEAGNQSNLSTSVLVTLDTKKPQISLDDLPATTGETALTVSGVVTDNTEIELISLILNDGDPQDLGEVKGSSRSFTKEIELVDGDNTIKVQSTDLAGNIGTSATVTVNLDNVLPTTAPANLQILLNVAGDAAKLSWDEDEQADSYNVYRSDATIDNATDLTPVLSNVTETSAMDRGLPIGKTVYYAVTSVDAAENEAPTIVSNSPNVTVIGSLGGTALLPDGTKARFGKMALLSDSSLSASVTIDKLDDDANALSGTTRQFVATSQTGADIETLNKPITITIPYETGESPQIKFLEGEDWTEIESIVDPDAKLVTAEVAKLGIYHLAEEAMFMPYDVKPDFVINIFDLVMVGSHFGESAQPGDRWDVKVDGTINIFDLVMVGSHFGETYGEANAAPSISTTEPRSDVALVAEEVDGICEVRLETVTDNLAGFQFDLQFDPSRLELVKVSEGNAFGKSWWLEPEIASGSITAASVALSMTESSKESVLATVSFKLNGDQDSALKTIKVNDIKLSDSDGKLIPVELDNAVKFLSNKKLRNALLANYPNPFNPETWIPYSVAQDSAVTVKIYNLLGQTVHRIDVGFVKAGEYISKDKAIYWDGKNALGESVSSGIYFYQIDVSYSSGKQFTAMRKLVILK